MTVIKHTKEDQLREVPSRSGHWRTRRSEARAPALEVLQDLAVVESVRARLAHRVVPLVRAA